MKVKTNKTKSKTVTGYIAVVPGTEEPFANVGMYGRYYEVLCDPDAKEQAEKMSMSYPESHQRIAKVKITYEFVKF